MTSVKRKFELEPKESEIRDILLNFCRKTPRFENVEPRITGGWVRDKLLGSKSDDIDIALDGVTGLEFAEALKMYLAGEGQATGSIHKIERNPEKSKHLETATTKICGTSIDFVNLRSEEYSADSRIPVTTFGTPQQDALRRDATLNALFYNLSKDEVEDFTGSGLKDLDRKLLRTPLPPFQTFDEDPLRVLRLIRFSARFGFDISKESREAMANPEIKKSLMNKISRERVGVEVEKMFRAPWPERALTDVKDLGLYKAVFYVNPRFYPKDFEEPDFGESEKRRYTNSLNVLVDFKNKTQQPLTTLSDEQRILLWKAVIIGVLWENVTVLNEKKKPEAAASLVVRDGLRWSNTEGTVISKAVFQNYRQVMQLDHNDKLELAKTVRTIGENWKVAFAYAFIVEQANGETLASTKYQTLFDQVAKFGLEKAWAVKPLVNGSEVAKILKRKPGPWMMPVLEKIVELQFSNGELTKTDVEKYLTEHSDSM